MILFLASCGAPSAPVAEQWTVDVHHSRSLFHTREISIQRVDSGQLALSLAPDGKAVFKVGHRYRSTTRSSKYARHGPSKSERSQSLLWAATGTWNTTETGVRVHLTERFPATWSTDGASAPADLTLDCRRDTDGLFCTGVPEDLRYLAVAEGEERRPWPGTRWIRSADAVPVLWFPTTNGKIGSLGVEAPVELTPQAVVLEPTQWKAPPP